MMREPITVDAQTAEVIAPRKRVRKPVATDPMSIAKRRVGQIVQIGKVVASDQFVVGGIAAIATYFLSGYIKKGIESWVGSETDSAKDQRTQV